MKREKIERGRIAVPSPSRAHFDFPPFLRPAMHATVLSTFFFVMRYDEMLSLVLNMLINDKCTLSCKYLTICLTVSVYVIKDVSIILVA